jgi:hypothetical protein
VATLVFVCVRGLRERLKQPLAAAWNERLGRDRCGNTSEQVLTKFYLTVTRKFRSLVPADDARLRCAREVERRHRLGWWDSMVVAAAQLQDCALLLTEDLHDSAVFGTVTVRSPFTLGVEEERAAFAPARAAPLHRPGGRPRRRG